MNFSRYNGQEKIQPFKKKVSTVFNIGDALAVDANGFVFPAVAATAGFDIVGISMETILATDADYAVARDVAVDTVGKFDEGDWFVGVVSTGTAAQTTVGELHDLDATGGIDQTAATTKVVKVERFISATKVLCSFANLNAS